MKNLAKIFMNIDDRCKNTLSFYLGMIPADLVDNSEVLSKLAPRLATDGADIS